MMRKLMIATVLLATAAATTAVLYRQPWKCWYKPELCVKPIMARTVTPTEDDDETWQDEVTPFERWRVRSKEEPVTFYVLHDERSNEHIARRGVLVTRPGAKATIVIMHGYTSGKTDMGGLRLLFSKQNLFLFDFRAHGEDTEGQESTFGYDEVYDVFAAVDFLRTRAETKNLPLIGYGFSMGAATAIEAQARDPHLFSALILDCPFDSSKNIIKRGLDNILSDVHIPLLDVVVSVPGREWLQAYAFHPYVQPILLFLLRVFAGMDASRVPTTPKQISPIDSAQFITVPTLFITCYADDRVPVDAVTGIYTRAAGYKRLWVTKGVRHYGSVFDNPELYQHVVANFIDKILSEGYKNEPQQRVVVAVPKHELLRMHAHLYRHPFPQELLPILYPARENKK